MDSLNEVRFELAFWEKNTPGLLPELHTHKKRVRGHHGAGYVLQRILCPIFILELGGRRYMLPYCTGIIFLLLIAVFMSALSPHTLVLLRSGVTASSKGELYSHLLRFEETQQPWL